MLMIALAIFKKFWPYILIGLLVLGTLAYIKGLKYEVSHYKAKAEQAQQALDDLKTSQEAAIKALEARNASITASFQNSLRQSNAQISAQQKVIGDKIRENKDLRSQLVSALAVRVFNDSTTSGSNTADSATSSVEGNDGASGATLADLLAAATENNARLLRCDAKVVEWQTFWTKIEQEFGQP